MFSPGFRSIDLWGRSQCWDDYFVGWVAEQTEHQTISQYYLGYLLDAVEIFEGAILRLKRCEDSHCDLADAVDMAHRIKGNAAMYSYPDLGLKAGEVEALLRAANPLSDPANALRAIIHLIDDIQLVCREMQSPTRPTTKPSTQATLPTQLNSPVVSDTPRRKRILLAYRDIWICDLMSSLLADEFDIISLNAGEDVELALQSSPPDLLILEQDLGDMTALELLRRLKAGHGNPSAGLDGIGTFIAFPPNSPALIAEGLSLGIDGFADDSHEILEIADFARGFLKDVQKRVLVVDDDPIVRKMLTHTLRAGGMHVDTATDGIEALAYLSDNAPDIILLDRFMPRLEGGTVLYEIQNKINLKAIPVLILTAMVNRGEAKNWFERGAADFIPKPFDPEEVLMRVRKHLDVRQKVA